MYKERSFYEFVGSLNEFNEMVEEVFEQWFGRYPKSNFLPSNTFDKTFNRLCWENDNTTIGEEK